MTEKKIQADVLSVVNKKTHCRLFRNNIGIGYAGQTIGVQQRPDGTRFIHIENPRVIRYGLQTGSGDLIGWKRLKIIPEMVGSEIAVFMSCEIKTATGKISEEQKNWMVQIIKNGGIAFIARCAGDVENL